jgi:NTP-dependent ternary system trypsin peptidase co-occuring protein
VSDSEIVEIALPEGRTMLAQIRRQGGGPVDVGLASRVIDWSELTDAIKAVGGDLWQALEQVAPHRAWVEFGLTLGVKSGKVAAMLVEGDAQASLRVRLEWNPPPATEEEVD